MLAGLPTHWLDDFRGEFETFAHDHQRPPRLANSGQDWTTWLMLGGRGAGKTRAGAEWVRAHRALADSARAHRADRRDRARSARSDGRGRLRPAGRASRRPSGRSGFLRAGGWNGRTARSRRLFSAEDPESLRGPQFSAAWCDELAKWRHAEATFDMLQFGLRLGERPRQVITTTPRPIALLKRLIADPRTAVTRAGTRGQCLQPGAGFPRRRAVALWRHAARPAGDRRRDHRGARRRAVVARADRAVPRRCGAGAEAHRGRGRSAGLGGAKAPMPAAWSRPGCARTAASMCSPTTAPRGFRRRAGRRRRSRCGGGSRPTRWWSRSTRAATWCAR